MLDYPSKSNHSEPEVRRRFEEARTLFDSGDREKAAELLEENLAEGCLDSMVLLGCILADGSEIDRERSIELFRMAANNDDPSGCRNLAYCYAIGLNVEKDKSKGAELYIKSALLGNARSACNIGVMSAYGSGVRQDYQEAYYWFVKSADGGYPRGMTNLGECYLWGRGTEKNVPEAIKWFERSETPRAFYRLYEIYRSEPGFEDPEKAEDCLKRSAEMGYSRGMVEYGRRIVKTFPQKAVEYFNRAAAKGNRDAASALEKLGLPVPESKRRSKRTAQRPLST